MDETEPTSATEDEDRSEADTSHTADRAPTEEEERLADEARERFSDDAESVAAHERSMSERGVEAKGEGEIE